MKVVVLTKQNYVSYLQQRLDKLERDANDSVTVIWNDPDDSDLNLYSYNGPEQKIQALFNRFGSDCILILHDGDIFAKERDEDTVLTIKDRVYTFHHEEKAKDKRYKHLFLDDHRSLKDLINSLNDPDMP